MGRPHADRRNPNAGEPRRGTEPVCSPDAGCPRRSATSITRKRSRMAATRATAISHRCVDTITASSTRKDGRTNVCPMADINGGRRSDTRTRPSRTAHLLEVIYDCGRPWEMSRFETELEAPSDLAAFGHLPHSVREEPERTRFETEGAIDMTVHLPDQMNNPSGRSSVTTRSSTSTEGTSASTNGTSALAPSGCITTRRS